jgi:DNA polymerase III epsilon subunit-like protein
VNYHKNGDGRMKNSMEHWNGSQICVIDTETTGLDSHWHEIIQIAIVALDSNIQPRKDVLPFYLEIKPDFPERIDEAAMSVNKLDACKIIQRGFDREKSKDMLRDWVEKLDLPYTKNGAYRKRVILLGQNLVFDIPFIKQWLGMDEYNDLFDYHFKDTMTVAGYLNDRAAMHGEPVPFSKINLAWLANKLNIKMERAHDALSDCCATAEVYRQLCMRGILG